IARDRARRGGPSDEALLGDVRIHARPQAVRPRLAPGRSRGTRRTAAVQLPFEDRDERPRDCDEEDDPARAEAGEAGARRDEQEEGGLEREAGQVERAAEHPSNATRTAAPRARSAAQRGAPGAPPRGGPRRSLRSRTRAPTPWGRRTRSRPSSAPA